MGPKWAESTHLPSRSASDRVKSRDVPKFVPSTGVGFMRPMYDPLVRFLACQRQIHDHLLSQLSWSEASLVADIGCGSGTLAIRAADRFPNVTMHAVDIDDRMLAQAKAKPGAEKVAWIQAQAGVLPIERNTFDVVICSLLLHHLTDNEKSDSLKEMHRLLRSGGKLLLADYDLPANAFAKLRFLVVRILDGWQRTRAHAAGLLPGLLEEAGFTNINETTRIATPLGTVRSYCAISS